MAVGIGIKTITPINASGVVRRDAELVAESIHRILNTSPGERVGDPEFGCRIQEVLFEQNDFLAATVGAEFIADAIRRFEPRVEIVTINPILNIGGNFLTAEITFSLVNDPTTLFGTSTLINGR
jgi:uncharacterized protein